MNNVPVRVSRRRYLAGVLAGMTAGCVGSTGGLGPNASIPTEFDRPKYAASYSSRGSWPQFGKTAARAAYTTESTIPTSNVGGAWLRTIDEEDHGATIPVVDDRHVYVGHTTALVAFDPKAGEQRWQTPLPDAWTEGIALVGDSVLVVTVEEDGAVSHLRAFATRDGTGVWEQSVPGTPTGNPAIVDDTILVAIRDDTPDAGTNAVYAYESDGTQRWRRDLAKKPFSAVFADSDAAFVTTTTNHIVALDLRDGAELWSSKVADPYERGETPTIQGTPALNDDHIYAPGVDSHLYAVNRSDGSAAWTTTLIEESPTNALPSPAVTDETVYVNTYHGGVIALAKTDGSERWRTGKPGGLRAPVASTETVICVHDAALTAYTSESDRLWNVQLRRGDSSGTAAYTMAPQVAVAHGMVYVSLADSRVYAIGGAN